MQRGVTDLQFLKKTWPSGIVARNQVENFTGGLIKGTTVANLDSNGKGPPEVVRIGRAVGYPVDSFVAWLETRVAGKHPSVHERRKRRTKNGKLEVSNCSAGNFEPADGGAK